MSEYIRESVQRLTGYTPGEQPRRKDIIKLNTNENPYDPSPAVRSVLQRLDVAELARYPDPVCSELRKAIADRHGCHADQVFVGNGSDEVLALCIRAFVERSGTVGFYDPSYSLYPVLAAIEDVATRPVKLGPDFAWNMPEQYAASLFFLTNPNAPTGLLYPRAEVEAFCDRFDGVVVIDEAYVDFSSAHCMDLALSRKNVLVARTLSKSFSLAGIRLGYVVGPQPLVAALFKIKDSYNVNRLSQEIALAALSDIAHMEGNVERIQITRGSMTAGLEQRGFEVFASETNFLWTKPSAAPAEEVFEALREDGVLVRYFSGEATGDYLRITVGTEGDMHALFNALDRLFG
jgi:histidinol-phosphate aminotransferase